MANPNEPLPDRARALLAAEREIAPVEDERRARMLARITRSTAGSAAPRVVAAAAIAPALAATTEIASTATSAADAGANTASLGAKFALLVKSKILIGLVAFGAGAGTGASIHAVVSKPSAPPPPSASAVAPVAPTPRPSVPRAPAPVIEAPSAEPSTSATPSALPLSVVPSPVPSTSSSSSSASARRERALIEQARIAVLHGDKASALSALRTHAVEFPDGQHREERETLMRRAEALP